MKIICVGFNYYDHIREMNKPVPTEPVIFLKPETALLQKNQPFFYPDFTEDLHYEAEVVLRINKIGKNIAAKFAHAYYDEIGIGIDFTARDLQYECMEKGLPWDICKGFNGAAPISPIFIKKEEFTYLKDINFSLLKNGELVQKGNTNDLVFHFDELIAHISKFFMLKIGDLIFTGTPVGVGSVKVGDRLQAFIEDKKMLTVDIK